MPNTDAGEAVHGEVEVRHEEHEKFRISAIREGIHRDKRRKQPPSKKTNKQTNTKQTKNTKTKQNKPNQRNGCGCVGALRRSGASWRPGAWSGGDEEPKCWCAAVYGTVTRQGQANEHEWPVSTDSPGHDV
jgi:hypothetical protein